MTSRLFSVRTAGRRPGRSRRLMVWAATSAAVTTLVSAVSGRPASADVVQPKICTGTWNIAQGTSWGAIGEMISDKGLDAFAVQEIGTRLPPGAQLVDGSPAGVQPVLAYSWMHGTQRLYLYLATGNINRPGALRVGVVTRQPADVVRYVAAPWDGQTDPAGLPTNPSDYRPAVGVQLGGRWYFSVHTGNNQGADPTRMVQRIKAWYPGADIMGDFNAPPASFYPYNVAPGHHTFSARTADGSSGGFGPSVLDYLVVDGPEGGARIAKTVTDIAGSGTSAHPSDHFPVLFGPADENGEIDCTEDPSETLAASVSTLTALAKASGAKYSYFANTNGGVTTRYQLRAATATCSQILVLDPAGKPNGFTLQAHEGQRDANVVSAGDDATTTQQLWQPVDNADGTVSYKNCANNQLLTADSQRTTTRDDSDALAAGQNFTKIDYPDGRFALSTAPSTIGQVNALPKASGAKYSYFGFGGSGTTVYSVLEVGTCASPATCTPEEAVYQIAAETSTGQPNGFALQAHEGQRDANVVSGASDAGNAAQLWQPVYNSNGTTSFRNVSNGQFLTQPGTAGSTLYLTTRDGLDNMPSGAQMFLSAAVS
jgi:hypothetical protein